MILGHIGVAFAAQRRWPRAPLAWLLVATMAPDIWRLVLSAAGVAWWPSNMFSHTLPWSGVLAVAFASLSWLVLRDARVAMIVLALVAAHIGLDMISGWKPLWIGGPSGLDLEQAEPAEFILEAVLGWIGWRLLPRAQAPRWLTTKMALLVMLAVQATYLGTTYARHPTATRCFGDPFFPCWKDL